MVNMLNKIELGAPWPEHMLTTRAVFLCKNGEDSDNPLAYRVLKITSGLAATGTSLRSRVNITGSHVKL